MAHRVTNTNIYLFLTTGAIYTLTTWRQKVKNAMPYYFTEILKYNILRQNKIRLYMNFISANEPQTGLPPTFP